MNKLILLLGLLLAPFREYEVIDTKSVFYGSVILARRVDHKKVVTNIEYEYKGEFDYLVYDKSQLKRLKD